MSENEQKKIFAENLNRYINQHDKTQAEIANAIGVSPQTFNTWVKGIAIPRMGKVQMLADYFHINKSDLIEEHDEESQGYYFNDEAAQMAQELYDRKELRVLFDASRNVSKEDILDVANILKKLKPDEYD